MFLISFKIAGASAIIYGVLLWAMEVVLNAKIANPANGYMHYSLIKST